MINATAIDHVCLWVRSLPDAKSYYEKIFGFACTPRENDETTLVVESENVHFFLRESKDENIFLSKQHIAFQVESLSNVIETLNVMGISNYRLGEVNCFDHKNYKWCEWQDPSGIRLECVEIVYNSKTGQ
ncbi:VOC family protein [Kaarinaea lacus]